MMRGGLILLIVVLALSGFAQQGNLTKTNAQFPETPPVKTIRVNDVDLAYVEQGRGEPVVLIHGFLHDYRVWSAQISELSKHYRVIAYSMRYRWPNKTRDNHSDVSSSADKDDLAALIQALKLGRAHLVGHSGGAALALHVAHDHPELVSSMVLGEPGMAAMLAGNPEARQPFTPELILEIRQAYEKGNVDTALELVVNAVLGKEGTPDSLPPWLRQILLDNSWQLTRLWNPRALRRSITCEHARRIKAPALLLGGDRSTKFAQLSLDALQQCMPASERAVLHNSSHGLELENPAGFNDIVLKFLKRHVNPR